MIKSGELGIDEHEPQPFEDIDDELSIYLKETASAADKIMTAINNVTSNQDLLLTSIYIKQANEGNFVRNLKCFDDTEFPYSEISLSRFKSFNKEAMLSDIISKENVEDDNDTFDKSLK